MKHYILVHGAWGGAWEFEELSTLLAADGSRVIAVDLPGHGDNKSPIASVTMAAYVQKVTEVIEDLDTKVILVGHSLAGAVISQVAENIPAQIDRLVFVAAALPRSGDSVLGLMESDPHGELLPAVIFSEDQSYATLTEETVREVLLHDVIDDARVVRSIPEFLMQQATEPFMAPVELSAGKFGSVPKYYIRASLDKAMTQSLQDRMITHWPVEKVLTLNSGHFPLTSMAEKLSKAINQLANHSGTTDQPESSPRTSLTARIALASVVMMVGALLLSSGVPTFAKASQATTATQASFDQTRTQHKTISIDGVDVFYREAGPADAPTVVLLHGFPTSSHMYRNLIPALSDRYHVIAPDYPGFGNSAKPDVEDFDYSFDNLAKVMQKLVDKLGVNTYSLYLMDYGAPIGFRMAAGSPERVDALIIQNGNAYDEGLREFWDPVRDYWKDRTPENAAPLANFITMEGVKWQYTHGVRNESVISPDNWNVDLRHLSLEGNPQIQLQLFYDYQNNVPHYPAWQAYFREHQPPTLIVWGKNDYIFPAEGAHPYKRDLNNVEFHLLDTGHFALEEDGDLIAEYIRNFLSAQGS